jgi:L-rhamnonate dehydratase
MCVTFHIDTWTPLLYHTNALQVAGGHWLVDGAISTPMARWEQYRASRTSWGINVLGSILVEIHTSDGTKGFATGFGGPPACWLVHQHFERFLIGAGKLHLISNLIFTCLYIFNLYIYIYLQSYLTI